ncbi:flagellar export chaperone FliS [uncultured Deefgea sp.]|uniref:flagellar export chaperone FliS n=1 Tax=uncultured Deefgea sp. TaxID=1304914 RepID=UPI002597FE91|nr:flagellar export chaperone FliS [uncultured Deefgea sp.]
MMNANKKALSAYNASSLDDQVSSASPHRLIVMLFDGAIKSINLAKFHLQQGNIAGKGSSITQAIAIVEEGLRLSLDKKMGGDLVDNLDALYEYASHQLLTANLRNDEVILDQILQLMNDLKSAWVSIEHDPRIIEQQNAVATGATRDVLSYGRA